MSHRTRIVKAPAPFARTIPAEGAAGQKQPAAAIAAVIADSAAERREIAAHRAIDQAQGSSVVDSATTYVGAVAGDGCADQGECAAVGDAGAKVAGMAAADRDATNDHSGPDGDGQHPAAGPPPARLNARVGRVAAQ